MKRRFGSTESAEISAFFKPVQPSKAPSPRSFTPAPRAISSSAVQPIKARSPMLFTPVPSVISSSAVQPIKARSPMLFTPAPSVILSSATQSLKASGAMLSSESGRVSSVMTLLPANKEPSSLTSFGKVTFSRSGRSERRIFSIFSGKTSSLICGQFLIK